ncbi:MAG: aspartate ammonia-lyase [Proteobacteria bacterium]|nr:MAG: aspartate ammonia-lyase [Pseudomonadota bacterium]
MSHVFHGATRSERDSLGEMAVPADALWGASTARALANFPVSGERFPRRFLRALGLVKAAAAAANAELGVVDGALAAAIETAAREVADGAHDGEFPLDVFQTGSGTSTNMNANEVIARLASRRLGDGAARVHPNDHVNASQSSNDVIPTALHVAAREAIARDLDPALARVEAALREKAERFAGVVKLGRTHLMDATPMRVGQEIGGWARQVALARERLAAAADGLAELALGGTAVGTGINCPPGFAARAIERIARDTGLAFREAEDHFEAQGARDAAVAASAAVRGAAVALHKIANDVRLLASGPRAGLGELRLPAVQPGSSIMPGKVNPVMAESVIQVAAQVFGNDAAVAFAGMTGQLELNAMIPVIARNLLESVRLLANVSNVFAERCLAGLDVDRARTEGWVEQSAALATPLAARIGYDRAAEIAKEAMASGRTVRDVARERAVLPDDELERLLDPRAMTGA